jgi:hypothetical protein
MPRTAAGPGPLRVIKVADRSAGERVRRFNPDTGEPHLVNPETGQPEPWPLLGLEIEGDLPGECAVPTRWVTRGLAEGWLSVENPSVVHRPGGPPEDPWRVTHTFPQADAVILKCVTGDVRYTVVGQPDKYDSGSETAQPVESSGDPEHVAYWSYHLKLDHDGRQEADRG